MHQINAFLTSDKPIQYNLWSYQKVCDDFHLSFGLNFVRAGSKLYIPIVSIVNIYHEGNISRLPDIHVFSLLDIHNHNNRSHGKRKTGNLKRKNKHVLTLSELSLILKHSG